MGLPELGGSPRGRFVAGIGADQQLSTATTGFGRPAAFHDGWRHRWPLWRKWCSLPRCAGALSGTRCAIAANRFLMAERLKVAGSDATGKKTSPNARCLPFPKITPSGKSNGRSVTYRIRSRLCDCT